MLAPSSPPQYPTSSPPAPSKRPRAPNGPKPQKPRALGGFLADDDSDDDEVVEQRSPKRRMLDHDTQDAQETTGQTAQDTQDSDIPAAQETATTPPDSQIQDDKETQEEVERYERLFGAPSTNLATSMASDYVLDIPFYQLKTCTGQYLPVRERKVTEAVSYETMVAARSRTKEGRAKKSYYGIDIHALIDDANKEIAESRKAAAAAPITPPANPDDPIRSVEEQTANPKKHKKTMLWTEKYRARNFMDLVGDDLTNRQVLRWLKKWDPLVFPHATKSKPSRRQQQNQQPEEEKPHRKILMLTGPPGLGKTTLAHVCARQAGYDVMEINASDERSKDVVKGRIRTSLGTETVKTVTNKAAESGKQQKIARPVCVVVDEVDGVVAGAGGSGDGGFVKALIDLVLLDQKNSAGGGGSSSGPNRRKKKGDDFRQMRPLILICNDVYHPSLRPLRQSGLAEIIHVGKPSVEAVVTRLKGVFEKEGIPCEKDAARKLCEAAWGMTSGIDAKRGAESNAEGDLRGIMVVGEWVAGRLKAASKGSTPVLTRQWVDKHILHDLAHGGGGARGLGRGGVKEIVNRIFQEGGGFPKPAQISSSTSTSSSNNNLRKEVPQAQLGFAEQQKRYAMTRLREMIDTSGEVDRIMTEVMLEYPNRDFNDDSFLSKPDEAYDWMHFHDTCSVRMFSSQEWELAPYAGQPALACHHLFACGRRHQPQQQERGWGEEGAAAVEQPLPFSGPTADFAAREALKVNRAALQGILAQLSPSLARSFRSPEHVATDLLPYLLRLVSPDVKPVLVGGGDKGAIASVRREGEKAMVRRAAQVLAEMGIELLKGKIEADNGAGGSMSYRTQWVYRMEPDLDTLATFESAGSMVLATQAPTRYAVRQVLDQELQKTIAMREAAARQARFSQGAKPGQEDIPMADDNDKENKNPKVVRRDKKDMFATAATLAAAAAVENSSTGQNVKKDFFGRVIVERQRSSLGETDGNSAGGGAGRRVRSGGNNQGPEKQKVWVTYHEGINNAVRKPVSLEEFLRGF